MKKTVFVLGFIFSSILAFAQTEETVKTKTDPLDVSQEVAQIELYGVPTFQTVSEMKAKADALYDSQSWSEAAIAYEQYAKHANWLANIVSQCVEPYYSARYDDKKNMSYTTLKTFIPYETAANRLKSGRNEAYVRVGLCYKKLGDINKAVTYLYKGLDILSLDQTAIWQEGASAIAEIVGFVSSGS